jgi:hypothetical protein
MSPAGALRAFGSAATALLFPAFIMEMVVPNMAVTGARANIFVNSAVTAQQIQPLLGRALGRRTPDGSGA